MRRKGRQRNLGLSQLYDVAAVCAGAGYSTSLSFRSLIGRAVIIGRPPIALGTLSEMMGAKRLVNNFRLNYMKLLIYNCFDQKTPEIS